MLAKKRLLILLLVLSFQISVFAETTLFETGKTIEEMLNNAAEYHSQKKFAEEIGILNKAIQLKPQSAEAYYKRCLAYYNLGRYDKARDDAYRAELEGEAINLTFIDKLSKLNGEFDRRKDSAGDKSLQISLAKEGLSIEDLSYVTQHYYENPQPDKLILIVRAILSDGWSIYDIASFGPFTHFVATVAHNNQSFLNELKNESSNFTGMQKDALNEIIYEADNFRSRDKNSPQGLDYLWAEFVATGSEQPVKKIISVLADPRVDLQMAKYSAEWSLRANAKQDRRVHKIIKEVLASSSGELKEKLVKILKN